MIPLDRHERRQRLERPIRVGPTPDPLNQAIVAIPIWLRSGLGLLLAHRVPADSTQPTV